MAAKPLARELIDEAMKALESHGGNATAAARSLGLPISTFKSRVNAADRHTYIEQRVDHPGCINLDVHNGVGVVFSDAHWWPDMVSTAHRALLRFLPMLRPDFVICNGDGFDGGSISRFPRIGWDNKPTVAQELKVVDERLGEIREAAKCPTYWTLGNHDSRYETFLASRVPEFQGVDGFALKDRFPEWRPAWSLCVNPAAYIPTIIKHRWKGGIHATHNNALNAGVNYITGHLHSLKVTPFTDMRGTRFGADSGTLADPNGAQFMDYSEDSPKNHRSGFLVLTFKNGRLLWPEVVHVVDENAGIVEFRGAEMEV